MRTGKLVKWFVGLELLGFLLVLGVIAADEFLDAPHYLFGTPPAPPRWSEYWFETGTILFLGVAIVGTTLWLLRRIRRLESFLVICAWCNKVRVGEDWIPVANYLSQHHEQRPSHGVCPTCLLNLMQSEGLSKPNPDISH
jgi:hypothetical protein